jgi:hypothetical protein
MIYVAAFVMPLYALCCRSILYAAACFMHALLLAHTPLARTSLLHAALSNAALLHI